MSGLLLAEFTDPTRFAAAVRRAHDARYRLLDAFSPFPVEGVAELLGHPRSHIRLAMFIGGMAMAVIAYVTQFYSAVFDYPYNSGGRPFDAWPTFMLVPFATGILVSAVTGFATFLIQAGLPRLHDPIFATPGFERASQDRFILALDRPEADDARRQATELLRAAGAVTVREIPS